jgi:hypothetical protein
MELIAAILLAGPLGYFMTNSARSLGVYLLVWAVIFPVQTIVVENAGDLEVSYFVLNAVILALGVGLNRLGVRVAERRRTVEQEASLA